MVSTPDLLTKSPDPRWILLTVQFEKHWFRGPAGFILRLHLPPGAGSQSRPGRVATWSPAPSRPCSEHLDPRTPAPSASAGLPPGAHVPPGQVVKIQLFVGREEGSLNLDLKAGDALA